MSYDLDLIDRRFPEILAALGWKVVRENEKRITGACPIHQGEDANFQLDLQAGGKWLAICRSQCGGKGWNATRFVAEYFNISHAEAITKAAELAGIRPENGSATKPKHKQRKTPTNNLAAQKATEHRTRISATISSNLDKLLAPYISKAWHADLWHSSKIELPPCRIEQARLFIRYLFAPEDTLWMGEEYDSGKPCHARNFRTREAWENEKSFPPRIAAGTFEPASFQRITRNLVDIPFIIIESDDLIGRKPATDEEREENRKLCAALIAFMEDRFKLTLRAVIDTGGKSLHGYFDRPSAAALEALEEIAEALAIDSQVIARAHNPLRLPNCIHKTTGQTARLCYLNPKHL